MSNTATQAIVRKSFTESFTFTGVPSEAVRKDLSAKGFKYRNGQWVRNQQEGTVVEESMVAQQITA